MIEEQLSGEILKAYFVVYNTLGYGFLEKVYENAMIIELGKMGLRGKRQVPIKVFYEKEQVGDYYADIIVNDKIIVELKACEALCVEHEAQLVNYLRATDIEVGLLLNFGKKPEFERKIFQNHLKKSVPIR